MTEKDIRDTAQNLVYKQNDLIQKARYDLTSTEQKLINYLISMVKPNDTALNEFTIKVSDFCDITGLNRDFFYFEYKKIIDSIDSKNFWIETKEKIFKFRWFNKTEYYKGKGIVKIKLSDDLNNYILGVRKNFTAYELSNILRLKGIYSIRFFEIFKSYEYKKHIIFDIDDIKHKLMAEKYVNFKDFRLRVLETSIKEIKEKTDLNVSYKAITKGRKVIQVEFYISRKDLIEANNLFHETLNELNEIKNKRNKK